jgi:energy-coupling factor transporter ATP-binding protein EcfA2
MSVIVFDGPEKSGKTTLIQNLSEALKGLGGKVEIRKQSGKAVPDETMYYAQLLHDASAPISDLLAIWDRSWASEYVYGKLLYQNRPMVNDPFAGEFLLGRLAQANGLRVILAGPDVETLAQRRDYTDLPVDPAKEQSLYIQYGRMFGWTIIRPESNWTSVDGMSAMVISELGRKVPPAHTPLPPLYAGKSDAEIIIVASRSHDRIAKLLGKAAFKVGWVFPHECPPETLRHAKTLVAYDQKSWQWVKNYVLQEGGGQELVDAVGDKSYHVNQIFSNL